MSDNSTSSEQANKQLDKVFFWAGMGSAGWILLTSLLFVPLSTVFFWSNIGSGIVLIALGARTFYRYGHGTSIQTTVPFVESLLGIWVVSSPYILDFATDAGGLIAWTNLLPGMIVGVFAAIEAFTHLR